MFPQYGVSAEDGTNLAHIGSCAGTVVLDIKPHRPWKTAEAKALIASLTMAVADAERAVAVSTSTRGGQDA
jgi:hypothetical protein